MLSRLLRLSEEEAEFPPEEAEAGNKVWEAAGILLSRRHSHEQQLPSTKIESCCPVFHINVVSPVDLVGLFLSPRRLVRIFFLDPSWVPSVGPSTLTLWISVSRIGHLEIALSDCFTVRDRKSVV